MNIWKRKVILWGAKEVSLGLFLLFAVIIAAPVIVLVFVISYTQCGRQIVHYRYLSRESPPIVEQYWVFNDEKYHLFAFSYDSNGDWLFDVKVRVKGDELQVREIPSNEQIPAERLEVVSNGREAKRLRDLPLDTYALNRNIFESEAYRKALSCCNSNAHD